MIRFFFVLLCCCVLGCSSLSMFVGGNDVEAFIDAARAAEHEGNRNTEIAAAWQRVVDRGEPEDLLSLLSSLDDASPIARNWIRGAIDALAERSLRAGNPLPVARLESFVVDTSNDSRARRLAYDWLARADSTAEARLIPAMLDDPSVELRRDAVALVLSEAQAAEKSGDKGGATRLYRKGLTAARDVDQINDTAKKLGELGDNVDLPRHFGFLMNWHVAAPFDNSESRGYGRKYIPEGRVDLAAEYVAAEYAGKEGAVRWQPVSTKDNLGVVDLNKAIAKEQDVLGFCHTEFLVERDRDVELRIATQNAFKLWLNGELLYAREEYHRGTELDHYRIKGTMRSGRNEILLKICQNKQEQDWAKSWQFQIRVCDMTGTAVRSASIQ